MSASDWTPRLATVMVDVNDLDAPVRFWKGLLGVGEAYRSATYVFLEPQAEGGVNLAFQRVPEAKATKNRVHVDLHLDDLDRGLKQVAALGGTAVREHEVGGYRWWVCEDPVGNEFCLVGSAPA